MMAASVAVNMKTSGLKKRLGGDYYFTGKEREMRGVLEQWSACPLNTWFTDLGTLRTPTLFLTQT